MRDDGTLLGTTLGLLVLALVALFLVFGNDGCGAAQVSPSGGAPRVEWRAVVGATASALPGARALVDGQVTDPGARLAADTAIDAGASTLRAISARSLCDALPQVSAALDRIVAGLIGAQHVGTPSPQTVQVLGIVAGSVGVVGVGVAIAQATQCPPVGPGPAPGGTSALSSTPP